MDIRVREPGRRGEGHGHAHRVSEADDGISIRVCVACQRNLVGLMPDLRPGDQARLAVLQGCDIAVDVYRGGTLRSERVRDLKLDRILPRAVVEEHVVVVLAGVAGVRFQVVGAFMSGVKIRRNWLPLVGSSSTSNVQSAESVTMLFWITVKGSIALSDPL